MRDSQPYDSSSAAREPGHGREQLTVAGEDCASLVEQCPTRLCALDPCGAAYEQFDAEPALDGLDRLRQRRLAYTQSTRGRGEPAFLSDRYEGLQLAGVKKLWLRPCRLASSGAVGGDSTNRNFELAPLVVFDSVSSGQQRSALFSLSSAPIAAALIVDAASADMTDRDLADHHVGTGAPVAPSHSGRSLGPGRGMDSG